MPNSWPAPGQPMSVGNLTNTYDMASANRSTVVASANTVTINLAG